MKNLKRTRIYRSRGFTLIELLTVIAIIGILAGILIPTVGQVQKQVKIAKTKARYQQYIGALRQFKSTYKFYPTFGANPRGDGQVRIELGDWEGVGGRSRDFIETLGARDQDGNSSAGWQNVNKRRTRFYDFSETDFYFTDGADPTQIADDFNNTKIEIYIDTRDQGFVRVDGEEIRVPIAIRSVGDRGRGYPEIKSWD